MPDTTRTEWREPPRAAPRSERWALAHLPTRLLIVAALLVATALVYWPSSEALAGFWSDTQNRTYTHGYLVLAISLWLIARDRGELERAALQPVGLALPALLGLSLAWLLFWRAAVQDLHLLLLPLILLTAIVAALGWQAARVVLFPLAFLYFAMPVWSDLVGILQHLSIQANALLIWVTGLPAYITGDIVQVPAGRLEIEEGCSGLHFLIVGLAMAALYGEVSRDSLRQRLVWLGLMGVLALVANWIRIFVIVVAAYATDMRTFLVTVDHYWFGWGVFAAAFAGFLWLAGRLAPVLGPPPGAHGAPATAEAHAPASTPQGFNIARCAAALACLAILPLVSYAVDLARPPAASSIDIEWPRGQANWTGPQPARALGWAPKFQNATAMSRRRYVETSGATVELLMVAYAHQSQGAKLLGYGNSLLGDESVQVLEEHTLDAPGGPWRQMRLVNALGAESLLWVRYRIGQRTFADARASQLWYGIASFTSEPVSSLLAIRTACEPGCEAAEARLTSAVATLQPSLRLTADTQGGGP